MLVNFTPRLYQETILHTASLKNTLVVLPTGLGKTGIALLLAEQRLKNYPNSKVIFFAPTKPLVEQHLSTFQKHMSDKKMAVFTGTVSPKKRKELFKETQIIFSTPQGFENDVLGDEINFKDVSLIVFDEAHRATGNYSYVFLAKQYEKQAKYERILALTASPGSELEKINEIIANLHIEEIEIRTEKDSDVKQYVQEVDINWVKVDLPADFIEIKKFLDTAYKTKLYELKQKGYINSIDGVSKKDLLGAQGALMGQISRGEKDSDVFKSVSLLSECLKVYHAIEMLETQGVKSLLDYFEKLEQDAITGKTQAVKNLVKDINFRSALIKTRSLSDKNIEHPKLIELKKMIGDELGETANKKIIVFSHFRDTANEITNELNKIKNVKATLFVGQTQKKNIGLSQKEQKKIIEDFKENKFNVLVATSVAEEGLDIPQVNKVIFYETVPSAIRSIQRKGRTGRHEKGEVSILMAKGTRDEHYRWSSFRKEKKMKSHLEDLKKKIIFRGKHEKKENKSLNEFVSKVELKIYADHREKGSLVLRELLDLGIKLSLEQLDIGDFILSSRTAVEYKNVSDFVDSIIDGRLLEQIKALKGAYQRPLLIVEGEEDIFSQRNIHPNAILGMFSTIAVSYGIPLLRTKNFRETANLMAIIARREQEEGHTNYSMHEKKPLTDKEQQEYIVSSFPGIGSGLAKPILKKFKTIKDFVNADLSELKEVEKIGEKKASAIKEIIDKEYE